jgi:isopentenyldiphosphate isomerase
MLDDTYVLQGDLRSFLTRVRGDDVVDAYSLHIKGVDMKYGSVRVTKPYLKSRYKYTIHETIAANTTVSVPDTYCYIYDIPSDYMQDRTQNRKQYDLQLLAQDSIEYPGDPRVTYYYAETYLCIEDYKNAAKYYEKRSKEGGYSEEKYDAFYKLAVMNHLHLGTPWEKCHQMYLEAFIYDSKRPESLFMIGYHYIINKISEDIGYLYLKKAFEIGLPGPEYGMNLKIEQYNVHLPRLLLPLCYKYRDYVLGEQATARLLSYTNDGEASMWKSIYALLNANTPYRGSPKTNYSDKKLVCFVIDGGWDNWDGETLRTRGLGGSETCVIRFAETIMKNYSHEFNVLVFCKCGDRKNYNNVTYIPIQEYKRFVSQYNIHMSLINRYTEIVPMAIVNDSPVCLMLHDLTRENDIILPHPLLKHITCLTDWHSQYVATRFPDVASKISTMSYGLESSEFKSKTILRSFIYPSFPTRGLYWLLRMFPSIVARYPDAHLNVFCNMEHAWCHEIAPVLMQECKRMLDEQKEHVTNHGWVNGETLKKYWATSHIWFYPTDFKETCCLTAWEAAASKTLAITSDLAALQESVGERGIVIPGDSRTDEWQARALQKVFEVLDNPELGQPYIDKNYQWVCAKNYDAVVAQFVNNYIR